MSKISSSNVLIGISIVAISISVAAIAIAGYSLINVETYESEVEQAPQTRDVYLFTQVDEHIDEEGLKIPPDQFSHDSIVVNKGDKVRVHFYNLEPVESQEHHTFTITDPAYKIHYDINAGEEVIIEFIATKSGVFEYICTFHQPTMRGELVVLD